MILAKIREPSSSSTMHLGWKTSERCLTLRQKLWIYGISTNPSSLPNALSCWPSEDKKIASTKRNSFCFIFPIIMEFFGQFVFSLIFLIFLVGHKYLAVAQYGKREIHSHQNIFREIKSLIDYMYLALSRIFWQKKCEGKFPYTVQFIHNWYEKDHLEAFFLSRKFHCWMPKKVKWMWEKEIENEAKSVLWIHISQVVTVT